MVSSGTLDLHFSGLTSVFESVVRGALTLPPNVSNPIPGQLFAIAEFVPHASGTPLAVGTLAVEISALSSGAKGKAVHVAHVWKDHLWMLGKKGDPPEPGPEITQEEEVGEKEIVDDAGQNDATEGEMDEAKEKPGTPLPSSPSPPPDEVAQASPSQTHTPEGMCFFRSITSLVLIFLET